MSTVFLDTVGLVALWDARDQWHAPACGVYEAMARERVATVTTDLVLFEVANSLSSSRILRTAVVYFRSQMQPRRCILTPTAAELEAAWSCYQHGVPGSFVDLVSFEVMRRVDAHEVFSNDRHFRTAGFITLF